MKKLIATALLGLLAVSCTEGKDTAVTADKKTETAQATPEENYLARVNDVAIKESDVREEFRMLPLQVQQLFASRGGMSSLLEELIKKELLYQEAKKRGYPSNKEFQRLEEAFRKRLLIEFLLKEEVENKSTVSDDEIKQYYDANSQDFVLEVPGTKETQSIELEAVADLIRQKLVAEKQQQVFDSYIAELKKSSTVELNEEAVSSAFGNTVGRQQ